MGKDAKPGAIVPKGLPKTGGGGAAGDLSRNWLLAPLILLGLVIGKKKIFKKFYLDG